MKNNLILSCFFSCFCLALNAQIYVSTTGVNASGRGSQTLPYKTISYAVSQAVSGNTVYIAGGTYNETNVIYIDKALTLVKNGTGNAIIDGQNRKGDTYMIGIVNNASNVTIDGIIIQNYVVNGAIGIWSLGYGKNITIKNCQFKNIGWISNDLIKLPPNNSYTSNAIKIEGNNATSLTNVLIQNNEVSNCATGWSEAITVGGNVDGFTIDNNKVHHISNIGIDITGNYYADDPQVPVNKDQARNGKITNNEVYNCMSGIANSPGIYLDGAINCTIEKNKCYNNGVGIGLGGEQSLKAGASQPKGHKVMNNLVYNNCITGIFLGTNNAATTIQNTTIYNNTFYKNRTGQAINGVTSIAGKPLSYWTDDIGGEISLQNSDGVTFKNNIVYPVNNKKGIITYKGYTVSNFNADYNLYYRDNTAPIFFLRGTSFNGITGNHDYATIASFTQATRLEAHSIFINPGFINASLNDFRLANTSLAINKGDLVYDANFSGSTDFSGNPRKLGGRTDIGAYENQTAAISTVIDGKPALAKVASVTFDAQHTLQLFPNPVKDKLTILNGLASDYCIFDVFGREVLRGHLLDYQTEIDISQLSTSLYFIKVKDELVKFFKQ
jgi:hypothetical protein